VTNELKNAKIEYKVESWVTKTDTRERLFTEIGKEGQYGLTVNKTPTVLVIIVCDEAGSGIRITIPISEIAKSP